MKTKFALNHAFKILKEAENPMAPPGMPPAPPQTQAQQPPAPAPTQQPNPTAPESSLETLIQILNDLRAAPSLNDGQTYETANAYFSSLPPEKQQAAIEILQGLNDAISGAGAQPQQQQQPGAQPPPPQTPPPAAPANPGPTMGM
jgi:hypothetical protein